MNPDNFVLVNHRFGREQGDRALREVASRLRAAVRGSDMVFRYGGAAFGVVLPATAPDHLEIAARKFQRLLSEAEYLDGQLELTFTVGGAVVDLDDLSLPQTTPGNVTRCAEQSLHKGRLAGDAGVLLISMSDSAQEINSGHCWLPRVGRIVNRTAATRQR